MDDANAAPDLILRAAVPGDLDTLHRFIVALAVAESFPGEVSAEADDLAEVLFSDHPVAEAVIAEIGGAPVGFALHYPTYSTVLGRRGIHLEDLYISDEFRGRRIGEALLRHLAELAVSRGCGRLEWWVLRTNESAIRFYRRLHARGLDEIEVMRLDGDYLAAFADSH